MEVRHSPVSAALTQVRGRHSVFGPLPRLYRLLLVVAALAVFVGIGAWLGARPAIPVRMAGGIAIGAALGLVATYLVLHDFHHRPDYQPLRVRRRPQ